MKALSLIATVFAALMIFFGVSSRKTAGVLSTTVIVAGAIILVFVGVIWLVIFIREKKEKNSDSF